MSSRRPRVAGAQGRGATQSVGSCHPDALIGERPAEAETPLRSRTLGRGLTDWVGTFDHRHPCRTDDPRHDAGPPATRGRLPARAQDLAARLTHLTPDSAKPSDGRPPPKLSTNNYSYSNRPVLQRPIESAQYLSLACTDRLAKRAIAPSVGSRGDSYDNALAEAVTTVYRTEPVYRGKPWRTVAEVELATAGWLAWYNQERLQEALGCVPHAEYEASLTGTSHPASKATPPLATHWEPNPRSSATHLKPQAQHPNICQRRPRSRSVTCAGHVSRWAPRSQHLNQDWRNAT